MAEGGASIHHPGPAYDQLLSSPLSQFVHLPRSCLRTSPLLTLRIECQDATNTGNNMLPIATLVHHCFGSLKSLREPVRVVDVMRGPQALPCVRESKMFPVGTVRLVTSIRCVKAGQRSHKLIALTAREFCHHTNCLR